MDHLSASGRWFWIKYHERPKLLDGFGMIHQFAIAKGAVHYSNKLVNSSYYQECCKTGKIRGSKPEQKKSTWSKLTSAVSNAPRPIYDNANITVQRFNDQLVATTETPHCIKIDSRTLESKSAISLMINLITTFARHTLFLTRQPRMVWHRHTICSHEQLYYL